MSSVKTSATALFPVRLEADNPPRLSRLSTAFRLPLAVPLLVFLGVLTGGTVFGFGVLGILIIAHWIAVLVGGRPVGWLFDFIVAVERFSLRAYAYLLLLEDRYPPFEGDWSVRFEVDRPERLSRWRLAIWKTATVIPHLIVLGIVFVGVMVVVFLAWFAVLFTGRYPEAMYRFVSGWLRWYGRVTAYWVSLTDEFPSFGFAADVGPGFFSSYVISAIMGWIIVALSSTCAGIIIASVEVVKGEAVEVTVSYEELLQAEPSAVGHVYGVEVQLLEVHDPYPFPERIYEPELGERLVLFHLRLKNQSMIVSPFGSVRFYPVEVQSGDLNLRDSLQETHAAVLLSVGGRKPPVDVEWGNGADVWAMFEVALGARPVELEQRFQVSAPPKDRVKFVFE